MSRKLHAAIFFLILCCSSPISWSALSNCEDGKKRISCVGKLNTGKDSYYGELKNNKRHGRGTNTWQNGETYSGEWQNNSRHGYGITKFRNGSRYEGEYQNNRRHGKGIFFRETEGFLAGYWRNGKLTRKVSGDPKMEFSQIEIPSEFVMTGSGSGFYVSGNGHLASNYHVIKDCQKVFVEMALSRIEARLIAADKKNDLAILQVDKRPSFFFPLSENDPALLEEIYAAGFPFGEALGGSVKVTKGIVSATSGLGDDESTVQIDAALQPGNSGGPILNSQGDVLGVAVAKLDFQEIFKKFKTIPEDTNFGVKVSKLKALMVRADVTTPIIETKGTKELGDKIEDATLMLTCFAGR